MLADLLKVHEGVFQSPAYRGHAPKSCALELLTLKQGLSIFEEADVIARDSLDKVLGRGKLAESNAEVIRIVESVEEVLVCEPLIRTAHFPASTKVTHETDGCLEAEESLPELRRASR